MPIDRKPVFNKKAIKSLFYLLLSFCLGIIIFTTLGMYLTITLSMDIDTANKWIAVGGVFAEQSHRIRLTGDYIVIGNGLSVLLGAICGFLFFSKIIVQKLQLVTAEELTECFPPRPPIPYADGPIRAWHVFLGYLGCIGVIAAILFDMYTKPKPDLIALGLEVRFVLPGFALAGLLGMFFFQLPERRHIIFCLLTLGTLTGIAIAISTPYFYPQFTGRIARLTIALMFQGLFSFSLYALVATGPGRVRWTKAQQETQTD